MLRGTAVLRKGMPLVLVGALVMVLVAAQAQAQPGGGRGQAGPGPRLTDAQFKAAWACEAKYVAGTLSLNDDLSAKLATAYEGARTGFQAAMAKKREEMADAGGDRRERSAAFRKAMQEATAAEQEKLKKALGEFLTEEQTTKAMEKLGLFNPRLDFMVHTLSEFQLGEKEPDALEKVYAYAVEEAKAMQNASPGQAGSGPQGMRERLMASKEKLDTALAGILSEEQLAKWKSATERPRRGRR